MKQENSKKRFLRNDIILIVSVIVVAVIGLIYLFCFRQTGDNVKVTVDGKLYGVYSVNEDTRVLIKTGDNDQQYNLLIIKNGRAYVKDASCPDGICSSHSKIYRDGESIVCLPNRVVITVVSSSNDDAPDTTA